MLKDKYPQPLYALSQQVNASLNFDSRNRLAAIQTPTLVLVGDEDIITPVILSEALKRRISNSQLCIISGSHALNIANAAMFNNAIIKFLSDLKQV